MGQIYYEDNIEDCYKKKDEIYNELSEMFEKGVAQAYHRDIFIKNYVELIENTPEEIKEAAFEMIDPV